MKQIKKIIFRDIKQKQSYGISIEQRGDTNHTEKNYIIQVYKYRRIIIKRKKIKK